MVCHLQLPGELFIASNSRRRALPNSLLRASAPTDLLNLSRAEAKELGGLRSGRAAPSVAVKAALERSLLPAEDAAASCVTQNLGGGDGRGGVGMASRAASMSECVGEPAPGVAQLPV
mmetsp:Transcript_90163/g.162616  ORF Transcript_90163/g.162616 Transcript_90163/m.162616 type:complete len:118 (+) Transcript_90163:134-487(+)